MQIITPWWKWVRWHCEWTMHRSGFDRWMGDFTHHGYLTPPPLFLPSCLQYLPLHTHNPICMRTGCPCSVHFGELHKWMVRLFLEFSSSRLFLHGSAVGPMRLPLASKSESFRGILSLFGVMLFLRPASSSWAKYPASQREFSNCRIVCQRPHIRLTSGYKS